MFTGHAEFAPEQMNDAALEHLIDQLARNRTPQDLLVHVEYQRCLEVQRERCALGVSLTDGSFHYRV